MKNPNKGDRLLSGGGAPLESENPLKIGTKTVFLGENAVFLLSSGGILTLGMDILTMTKDKQILDSILIEIMVDNGET